MRDRPIAKVAAWVSAQPSASVYTTSITQAEVLHGIRVLPAGKRRNALDEVAEAIFRDAFPGRILFFGSDAARAYAVICADRRRLGRPIAELDAQIAAIARATRASLATRNVSDFDKCGIDVVDPWA